MSPVFGFIEACVKILFDKFLLLVFAFELSLNLIPDFFKTILHGGRKNDSI